MAADADWRREIHEQLDAALSSLDGVVAIVVLVEYLARTGNDERRELVVRASLTNESHLAMQAIEAVRKLAP